MKRALAAGVASLLWLAPSLVGAHGDDLPYIAFWNLPSQPFSQAATRCQRALGHARQQCLATSLRLHDDCRRARARGAACDAGELAAEIAARQRATTEVIEADCSDELARELHFLTRSEAVIDKDFICARVPEEMLDLVYAPVESHRTPQASDCAIGLAALSKRYVKAVAAEQTRSLNRIAVHSGPPSVVLGLINRTTARIGRIRTAMIDRMLRHCPAIRQLYGMTATQLLLRVELHGHCAVGAGYIQSAYVCPRGYLPR